MSSSVRHLLPLLAVMAMGSAQAEVLTVKAGGATFQGTGTLSFSAEMLQGLDIAHIGAAAYGNANATIQKDTDGFYTAISTSAPLSTVSVDIDSLVLRGMATKGGGLTLTAPAIKSLSSGGSLSVSDIAVDVSTQTVLATVVGANGVGILSNVALWHYSTQTGPTEFKFSGALIENDFSGLYLTNDGAALMLKALGMQAGAHLALTDLQNLGTVHTVYKANAACCDPMPPAVPEPSAHALMGLGLLVLAGGASLVRRRAA